MIMMLEVAVATTLLFGVPNPEQDATADQEASCLPAADLEPRASAGTPATVSSTLTRNGELLRWTAASGDTLRLTLVVAEPGTYAISLLAVHRPDGPELSAKLWEEPLTRNGEAAAALRGGADPEVLAVRFDPVSLGPGRHYLELSTSKPGEVLLDCVTLRKTGERLPSREAEPYRGMPFLGVEMGEARDGGVTITRTIPGTAAEEAGLEAGDVLVTIDGEPIAARSRVRDVLLAHEPGDRIELAVLREGERLEKVAVLGRRSDSDRRPGSRAARVIEVLDVQPGQVIADIGCGSGWLSEAIAATLGPEGLVYAVEIDESRIRRLRRRSSPNVVPVLSVARDVSLPEKSLDTAMLHDVASHVARSARPRFYQSVARALKPEGQLVIFGPHGEARSMLDDLRRYGFVPEDDERLAVLSDGDLDQQLQDGIVFRYRPASSH